jgi:hypothetical protein
MNDARELMMVVCGDLSYQAKPCYEFIERCKLFAKQNAPAKKKPEPKLKKNGR